MDFSVTTFRNSFKEGLSSPTKFAFRFAGSPPCLQGSGQFFNDITMHVHRCNLPDQAILTNNWQVHGGGIPVKYPFENSTQDVQLEIICSSDHWEKRLFTLWQKSVINYSILAKNPTFLIGYYDDYVVNAEIDVFNQYGDVSHTIILESAWPSQVAPVDMNWSAVNQPVLLSVSISYAYWSYKDETPNGKPIVTAPASPADTTQQGTANDSSQTMTNEDIYSAFDSNWADPSVEQYVGGANIDPSTTGLM